MSPEELAELEAMRCRLFDLANAVARESNDAHGGSGGNAGALLHAASSEISRALKCIAAGNKSEPIPEHLLIQSLGGLDAVMALGGLPMVRQMQRLSV